METAETRELEQRLVTKKSSFRFWEPQRFLTVGSLGFAIVQGVCATAVFVSGISTALGFSTVAAATAAGPATGFHANRFRIPMLALAGVGANGPPTNGVLFTDPTGQLAIGRQAGSNSVTSCLPVTPPQIP